MKFKNPLSRQKFYRPTINDVIDGIFEILLYFACFFPFVRVIPTNTDTQPNAALIAILIIILYWIKDGIQTRKYWIIAVPCVGMGGLALLGIFFDGFSSAFRSYFSYVSLICIPLAVLTIMKKRGGLNETLVKVCVWIWFIVGFIQKYYVYDFGYSILSRHTTGKTRGAVSLATEPSAYGYMCLFMILIVLQMKRQVIFYTGLLLLQIVVFASSSVTIVYIGVYVLAYMLNELFLKKKFALFKTVGVAGLGIGGLFAIKRIVPPTNRMGALVNYLFEEPQKIIEDESIVMRVEAITFSFESFIENNFMPHGMYTFKIMSGIGGLFYECGFIALIILVGIGVIIYKGSHRKYRLMYLLGYMIIMFSSIPFSAPLMCFYLGVCLWSAGVVKEEQQKETVLKNGGSVMWYHGKIYREIEDEGTVDM